MSLQITSSQDQFIIEATENIESLKTGAINVSKTNNMLAAQYAQMGIESPLYVKTTKGKEICQKGLISSVMISTSPLLNAGTSGATYAAGDFSIKLQIDSNLAAQTTIVGIPQGIDSQAKFNYIRNQIKFLIKKGDVVEYGQPWFAIHRAGVEVLGETYSKGVGDFSFHVLEDPCLEISDVRFEGSPSESTSAQVSIKVRGENVAVSQVEKVCADGIKSALVPMPQSLKTLKDLYLGGFLAYESQGDHKKDVCSILNQSADRIPHASISIGGESYKGASALRNAVACHSFLHHGQRYELTEQYMDCSAKGNVIFESDAQIAFSNKVAEYQVYEVTLVRALSQAVWLNWKAQHEGNLSMSFVEHEGLFLVFHTTKARYCALHLTVELSSTLENRSWKSGMVFLEALSAINTVNPFLGRVLYLTGASNRTKVDMLLQCAGAKPAPENLPVWTQEKAIKLPSGSLKDVLMKLPSMLWIEDSQNRKHLISFGLSAVIGMTPSGGTNTLAKAGRDLALHFALPVSDRPEDWSMTLNRLLGMYRAAVTQELAGSGKQDQSKLLKDRTKSGKVLNSCKVRGINTSWSEPGKVYVSSKDLWAAQLKGKTVMYYRNPMCSYKAAQVVIVGPDDIADIKTDRDVLGSGVLYVEHQDWYITTYGDDDGK